MLAKFIIVLFLIGILFCLGSALYYLFSGRSGSGMVKALTVRIILSVVLFILLMVFFLTGVLQPHGVMLPAADLSTAKSGAE